MIPYVHSLLFQVLEAFAQNSPFARNVCYKILYPNNQCICFSPVLICKLFEYRYLISSILKILLRDIVAWVCERRPRMSG